MTDEKEHYMHTVTDAELAEARVEAIRDELTALLGLLPDGRARQWDPSPVARPREDTSQRSIGGAPSDPTSDTVLDARRLAVSDAVSRAERVLEHAARALRERREALDLAVRRYDGE